MHTEFQASSFTGVVGEWGDVTPDPKTKFLNCPLRFTSRGIYHQVCLKKWLKSCKAYFKNVKKNWDERKIFRKVEFWTSDHLSQIIRQFIRPQQLVPMIKNVNITKLKYGFYDLLFRQILSLFRFWSFTNLFICVQFHLGRLHDMHLLKTSSNLSFVNFYFVKIFQNFFHCKDTV